MQDYERLGVFYLGRNYDLDARQPTDELLLYDSKDLTTHAVCVGMTGSGKTGLCLALLEEAAIDGIPAIIIDPKGDLGNLLLTFPQLQPQDFEPWIDPADAQRAGVSLPEYAAQTAASWKAGLAEWGQEPERIQRFREAVDVAIYTPGSSAGLPLTVLRSFHAPPAGLRESAEAFQGAISAAASGLLGLLGIEADPLKSREHILLSNILDRTWREGRDLDMPALIREIQSPPFDKIGVIDLESVFPAQDRFELAMQLNNLLASPGFAAWMDGEPLDVQRLLYTPEGKPRLAILSIAHLSDAERMFFVTILLSEVINWMRSQSGTSSLRAILYMDEIFRYFPPSKNPPSKIPMLTLLKQARAYGLGVVLATQNPVDLDYKGLANCGTWFLGRLQTERDKLRVLDGLEGATSAAGVNFDRAQVERTLSGLRQRMFLMNNVHEAEPIVFQSRWALSFLRGPLTRDQISKLMNERLKIVREMNKIVASTKGGDLDSRALSEATKNRPILPPEISERFIARRANLPQGATILYRPALLGQAKLHFANASAGVDAWQDLTLLLPIEGQVPAETWAAAEDEKEPPDMETQPEANARFAELPGELSRPKRYVELAKGLKDELYRNRKLKLWKCPPLKRTSSLGQSETDFRISLSHLAREQRDEQVEKLRQKYAPKFAALEDRKRRAEIKVEKERSQANQQTLTAVLSAGSSIFGALFGRKLISITNLNRAATSARAAGRIARQRQDISDATESAETWQQRQTDLESQFKEEKERIQGNLTAESLPVEEILVQPKKSEINVSQVALVWVPWIVRTDGALEPGD